MPILKVKSLMEGHFKMLLRSLCLVAMSALSIQAFAYDAKTCEIKKQKIQEQLVYAKKYSNTFRIRGLERALVKVERKCNAAGYSAKNH